MELKHDYQDGEVLSADNLNEIADKVNQLSAGGTGPLLTIDASGAIHLDAPLPVSQGGTGASTAGDACRNLEAASVGVGQAIPAGADLNSYTSPGIYYSVNGSNSQTLANVPYNQTGFRLAVYNIMSEGQIIQEFIANSLTAWTFRRVGGKSGSTWSFNPWQTFIQASNGIVPVGKGGTGCKTEAELRTYLKDLLGLA